MLHFSTFLYCDLSCELWKIYCAEFRAPGWLSECWFSGSICRQFFFSHQNTQNPASICSCEVAVLMGLFLTSKSWPVMDLLSILWFYGNFLFFWKWSEDTGYRATHLDSYATRSELTPSLHLLQGHTDQFFCSKCVLVPISNQKYKELSHIS